MLENEVLLRAQLIAGVKQEIWGSLIAYNLVRLKISRIAKDENVSPLRISFTIALRDIQDELPKQLRAMRERIKRYILREKQKRSKAGTVRINKTRYTARSKHLQ